MVQPRYKTYTQLTGKKRGLGNPILEPQAVIKFFLTLIALIIVAACVYYILYNMPASSSLEGEYVAPASQSEITEYSRARWSVHNAHENILTACVAWYSLTNGGGTGGGLSLKEIESAGFLPFRFFDPEGKSVQVLEGTPDFTNNDADYILAVGSDSGGNPVISSRKTYEVKSIMRVTGKKYEDSVTTLNPDKVTSVITQFQPDDSQFDVLYSGFLAQVWDLAVVGFASTYNRPPTGLDDLLRGVGLEINADCGWPFDPEEEIKAGFDGGVIDGNIVYWRVTYEDGSTGGQARYWDLNTSYDDPGTPENIVAGSVISPVVKPSQLTGTFNVMFSLDIFRDALFALNPPPEPVEEP